MGATIYSLKMFCSLTRPVFFTLSLVLFVLLLVLLVFKNFKAPCVMAIVVTSQDPPYLKDNANQFQKEKKNYLGRFGFLKGLIGLDMLF